MTSTEMQAPVKTCTCDDKFILFMKSKQFETVLKDAMQNVMGEIIRNILKHQIREDLSTIIGKMEKMELDLKCIRSKYDISKKNNEEGNRKKNNKCHNDDDADRNTYNQNGGTDDNDDDEETSEINNDNTYSKYRNENKENNDHGMYKLVLITNCSHYNDT